MDSHIVCPLLVLYNMLSFPKYFTNCTLVSIHAISFSPCVFLGPRVPLYRAFHVVRPSVYPVHDNFPSSSPLSPPSPPSVPSPLVTPVTLLVTPPPLPWLLLLSTGQSLRMIFCKRPALPDDHLQEAGSFGGSFARGRLIRMIICKRLGSSEDYLQGGLFARGRPT